MWTLPLHFSPSSFDDLQGDPVRFGRTFHGVMEKIDTTLIDTERNG